MADFNKEYKGEIFYLVGREGTEFKDLRVIHQTELGMGRRAQKEEILRFTVKVIGLEDSIARDRSWGKTYEDYFKNSGLLRYLKSWWKGKTIGRYY